MIRIRLIADAQDAAKFLANEQNEMAVFPKRKTIAITKKDDAEAAAVFKGFASWYVGNAIPGTTIPGRHHLIET